MTALRNYLLAFADDEHLIGQQHIEWIGVAPFLEEDLAFSSIGQDELGHAVMLYELVLGLDDSEPTDTAIDALAYRRTSEDYRSSAFVEFGTTDWAEALVRHWLYDLVEELRWGLVASSSFEPLAVVAQRASREESFHRRHADALLDKLLSSPSTDARFRLLAALDTLLPKLSTLLETPEGEAELIAQGVASASLSSLHPRVIEAINQRFETTIDGSLALPGSRQRRSRSEAFEPLMARMCEVLDLDPSASW